MADTPVLLPDPKDWHTIEQLLAARPYLTARAVRSLCEQKRLRYSKRGAGLTAMRLYKLADVDACIDGFVVEPEQ